MIPNIHPQSFDSYVKNQPAHPEGANIFGSMLNIGYVSNELRY